MSAQLGPPLIGLFAPRPPLRYLPAADTAPEKRSTKNISGIAQFLPYIGQHDQDYLPTETFEEKKVRRREEKKQNHLKSIKEGLQEYNPNEDTQVRGDPYKTLFVSRLAYDVTEDDLEREFSRYGPLERTRLVCNSKDNKPRGYAFLVFEREKDMKAAYKDADGIRMKDRRILVDVERGRTVKEWKPMRLGGGLGGRHYTKPTRRIDNPNPRAAPRPYAERSGSDRMDNGHARNDHRYGGRQDYGAVDPPRSNDRGPVGRNYGAPRPRGNSPGSRDRGLEASRSQQGRQGIGFDRGPERNGPPIRNYQDNHIGFAPASGSIPAPSYRQGELDPRARQAPIPYSTNSSGPPAAPSAPWLNSSSGGGAADSRAGRGPRDRSYDRYDDRDLKRRRY